MIDSDERRRHIQTKYFHLSVHLCVFGWLCDEVFEGFRTELVGGAWCETLRTLTTILRLNCLVQSGMSTLMESSEICSTKEKSID